MIAAFRPAFVSLLLLSFLTGVLYPLAVTGIAQVLFPHQANGSLIFRGQEVVGSELIGQPFDDPRTFWGRPSATGPHPYNGGASSGSNLGPTNSALQDAVRKRVEHLRMAHPGPEGLIPVDLVTASGSGLDPHISPAAAEFQVERVAQARHLPPERMRALVAAQTQGRTLGLLGEPRVHVLRLNLSLDELGR